MSINNPMGDIRESPNFVYAKKDHNFIEVV